ncbi:hypothetical protein IMSHALPRED_003157 [Imshaugia aleurites]|uniref:Uncharacterized protein n=1 Tax=Imshaugia aleurites TaxID=172621 RepID=A0A8H3J736_9LECA|nr:hypothetical protein IMSHALPRED_003157 [Imshaugia aleurites]
MSLRELKAWNKEHGFATSHNKAELIEQAKTGRHIVVTRGKRVQRNLDLEVKAAEPPIEPDSDPKIPEGPEYSNDRNDAIEPDDAEPS